LIEELTITGAFAGVITRAAVRTRQRVLFHVLSPCCLVVAGLCQGEPRLDVLPGRTGVVAGRKVIDVNRTLPSPRAGPFADRLFVDRRQILRNTRVRAALLVSSSTAQLAALPDVC
jgi:hypothetical protein